MPKKITLIKPITIAVLSIVFLSFSQLIPAAEYDNTTGNTTISTGTAVTGDKWIKAGNLTINSGVTVQINANSSLTFEPGYHITKPGAYILKSTTNARIIKGAAGGGCQCSSGPCCDGCNFKPTGTACDVGGWTCDGFGNCLKSFPAQSGQTCNQTCTSLGWYCYMIRFDQVYYCDLGCSVVGGGTILHQGMNCSYKPEDVTVCSSYEAGWLAPMCPGNRSHSWRAVGIVECECRK